jgi:hypothetical protein
MSSASNDLVRVRRCDSQEGARLETTLPATRCLTSRVALARRGAWLKMTIACWIAIPAPCWVSLEGAARLETSDGEPVKPGTAGLRQPGSCGWLEILWLHEHHVALQPWGEPGWVLAWHRRGDPRSLRYPDCGEPPEWCRCGMLRGLHAVLAFDAGYQSRCVATSSMAHRSEKRTKWRGFQGTFPGRFQGQFLLF